MRPVRWRRVAAGRLDEVTDRLRAWPCEAGGAARHMFPLDAIERFGLEAVRTVTRGDRFAACVLLPARVLVPCGDPGLLAAAGLPTRRWRLLVGDAAAADGVLRGGGAASIVHRQRFLVLDPERVPSEADVPDPGLRLATPEDLPRLAELAVQLHVDDGFGPDPGRAGLRGYGARMEEAIQRDQVWCVGPPRAPFAKLERAVSNPHLGVQLAGIVVAPERRGEGLGRAMVAAAVRGALGEPDLNVRTVALHVRVDNTAALSAYRAAGFVEREDWRLALRN